MCIRCPLFSEKQPIPASINRTSPTPKESLGKKGLDSNNAPPHRQGAATQKEWRGHTPKVLYQFAP